MAKIAPWCLASGDKLLAKVPGPVAGWTAPPTLSAHTRNRYSYCNHQPLPFIEFIISRNFHPLIGTQSCQFYLDVTGLPPLTLAYDNSRFLFGRRYKTGS
jgi:hypothetical protein